MFRKAIKLFMRSKGTDVVISDPKRGSSIIPELLVNYDDPAYFDPHAERQLKEKNGFIYVDPHGVPKLKRPTKKRRIN